MVIKNKKSFTLIETIAIIVILFCLVALTIPAIQSFYAAKLRGAASKLASDIRYAQRLAISQHKLHGVKFSPDEERYYVYHTQQLEANIIDDPLTRQPLLVDYTSLQNEYCGLDIFQTDLEGNRIEFDSLGIPYDANGILTIVKRITLQYKGQSVEIKIVPKTGSVRIE